MNPAVTEKTGETCGMAVPETLGLIAGSGEFPFLVARSARTQGVRRLVAIGFKSQTDPELTGTVDEFHTVGVGQLGKLIDIFKKSGVCHAIMAGKLQHKIIFKDLRLDMKMLGLLARLKDRRADTILGGIVREMEKEGIQLMDSVCFLGPHLAREGVGTRNVPTKAQWEDIAFGRSVAVELARLDIGQAVAVKDKAVVAVEGLEGTDEMVLRAGQLAGKGITVVKVNKPGQDMRFDVPVVGGRTLEVLHAAHAAVLAVAAGKTLILDKDDFFGKAQKMGIAVVGVAPTEGHGKQK